MDKYIKRKNRVILTAIDIIDEFGFRGLSTKEICKRQNISEGCLYRCFKNKDEIILGILDIYVYYDEMLKETIEISEFSTKDSIRFIVKMISEHYENYPAISSIMLFRESFLSKRSICDRAKEAFESRYDTIVSIIKKGTEKGDIKSDIDAESIACIILGSCKEIVFRWRIENYKFSLKEKIMHTVDLILQYL